MSRWVHEPRPRELERSVPVFAALGDATRIGLLDRLGGGSPLSISKLAEGSPLTRQAITKHLLVLQRAGLVKGVRSGRETRFALERARLDQARRALDNVSRQWDDALARLKAFVEEIDGAT